jgi:hypothetical protein
MRLQIIRISDLSENYFFCVETKKDLALSNQFFPVATFNTFVATDSAVATIEKNMLQKLQFIGPASGKTSCRHI